jgi:hypothetical protein
VNSKQQAARESRIVWLFFLVTILMVNPPVLTTVNAWFVGRPLLWGWPTMWLYLSFWYLVMLGGFIYFALRFKSWQAEPLEEAVAKED